MISMFLCDHENASKFQFILLQGRTYEGFKAYLAQKSLEPNYNT